MSVIANCTCGRVPTYIVIILFYILNIYIFILLTFTVSHIEIPHKNSKKKKKKNTEFSITKFVYTVYTSLSVLMACHRVPRISSESCSLEVYRGTRSTERRPQFGTSVKDSTGTAEDACWQLHELNRRLSYQRIIQGETSNGKCESDCEALQGLARSSPGIDLGSRTALCDIVTGRGRISHPPESTATEVDKPTNHQTWGVTLAARGLKTRRV